MSFHLSAEHIVVDGGVLKAKLGDGNGHKVDAKINLNDFVGNNNGRFEWGGKNFTESASHISFSIEGDANVPILRATLNNLNHEPVQADLNLAERISNQGGKFVFE